MGNAIHARPSSERDAAREIEAIMAEHETALLRYAARLLNNSPAAQDVVQDTFVKLYRFWRDGAWPAERLSSWLYRVTHNAAVDHMRLESRLRLLHTKKSADPTAAADDPPDPPRQWQRGEQMDLALAHMHKLDSAEQQVLILRLQEGLAYKEIATITGRSEGNVGCLLHHAVKKLAASLKKAGALTP